MRPFVLSFALLALVISGTLQAQAPAGATGQAAERLPVRRVVLYKSGVGYFEHLGQVRGAQTVSIDFTSGQLDDVLKSLTALDLDGGRVTGVSYNSEAALDRRLGALRLPVGDQPTRAQFLAALRGARVDVRAGATRVTGRLLGVERLDQRGSGGISQIDAVSVVTDGGEIHTIPLEATVTVRIVETDLNQEVGRYLTLLSSARDQDLRRLSIATTGAGDRDLFVSYVSEVPVWKATYRLVLPNATPAAGQPSKPLLQGWAIVDNTVGEDWEGVELSLVAGAPQSFIQQISRPYYVQRPIVPLPERMLLSPQTHQSALGIAGNGAIAGTVTDTGGGTMPGVTVQLMRNGTRVDQAVSDESGRFRLQNVAPGTYDVQFSLSGFRTATRSGVAIAGGMETVMNVALQPGSLAETMTVTATLPGVGQPADAFRGGGGRGGRGGVPGGMVGGVVGGLPSSRLDSIEEARLAQQAAASGAELGDLFEYKLKEPITIRKNQSALVPILSSGVEAEKVSIWNAATPSARALRAVWLTNATGLTLDGGTFSVIEGQAFAGEGLIEPLKAGERRLLSYALDLAVTVDARSEGSPTRTTRVRVSRGVVIQETEDRRSRVYTIRNEDSEARTIVVEHPAQPGWNIGGTMKPAESTAAVHRFRVPVAAKTTATFTVDETRPLSTQIVVSSITDAQVALFVREKALSAPLEAALREVIARKANIARLDGEIATRQREMDQIARDQERVRENMKSLKGTSEERQLVQRYVRQLDDQENRIGALRKELDALTTERQKAQADVEQFIAGISG